MRIAQVSPLFASVPPRLYGGTERVVAFITEGLVRAGHDVTLFATADSRTSARLVAPCERPLDLNHVSTMHCALHLVMVEQVLRLADEFDLIHFHLDLLHYPLARRMRTPHVTTLHGRLDIPDLVPLYREFNDAPVISISDAQRDPLPWLNWQATVQHGLPKDLFSFREARGDYLAFLGRISPEKGLHCAIEIARRVGLPLKIGARIDLTNREYYEERIKPLLVPPAVEYVGEVDERGKAELLGGALALLFPIDWPEPFGLVLIEALACGTPVLAFRRGSVPEIVTDGDTGVLCEDVEDAIRSIERLYAIKRRRCREVFDERFTRARMVERYVSVYRRLARERVRPFVPAS